MNWDKVKDYQDIIYEKCEGIAKITINRPERRNAFRPETVNEMYDAFIERRIHQLGTICAPQAVARKKTSQQASPQFDESLWNLFEIIHFDSNGGITHFSLESVSLAMIPGSRQW